MRRFLAALFVVFFGFGPLAATLEASDNARLPACCRTHGAHHCAMSSAMRAWMFRAESRAPGFSAPSTCPLYPGFLSQAIAPAHALPVAKTAFITPIAIYLISVRQRIASTITARIAQPVRGPPAA